MTTQKSIFEKLKILETLYQQGESNAVVEDSIDQVIAYEISLAQQELKEIETNLSQLEMQYQMSSSEFFQGFQTGELGDHIDFVEWNAFYQMSCYLKQRLKILQL